jgi:cell division protein FtsX
MITLNLLSQDKQDRLKQIRIYAGIKNAAFLMISIALIILTLFYFTQLLLKSYQQSLANQIDQARIIIEQGKATTTEDVIKLLNEQLIQAKSIQSRYISWPQFMKNFVATMPVSGIKLSRLDIDSTAKTIKINGTAASRDAFLLFETNLKNFPYLSDIISPLTNLAQSKDAIFEVTATLTPALYE